MVSPDKYIRAIAAAIAAGMPAATQKAVLTFKNKNKSNKTSPRPCSPFSNSIASRAEIASERVRINSIFTCGGNVSIITFATACTCAWISIASPWSDRSMRIEIAGASLTKYARLRSTPSSITEATSPTVKPDPSAFERSTISATSRALRLATPVRIRALPATSPAGSAFASSPMALAICAILTSWRIKDRLSTSTIVEPAAIPLMLERVTPTANRRVTNSSANKANCSTPTGPEITTSVTRSRQNPRFTLGSSASSGNWLATESTAICVSSVPRAISQPGSNSMRMRADPSEDVAEVLVTPSIPSNAGSTI